MSGLPATTPATMTREVDRLLLEGMSRTEVARRLDVPPRTVYRRAQRLLVCDSCGAALREPARLCGFCVVEEGVGS